MGSSVCNLLGNGQRLLARFDRARARHHDDVFSANRHVAVRKPNNSGVRLQITTHKFVGLTDANDFADAWHLLQASGFQSALIASDADCGSLSAGNGMGTQSKSFDLAANVAYLLFCGMGLHYNQHSGSPENVTASVMNS